MYLSSSVSYFPAHLITGAYILLFKNFSAKRLVFWVNGLELHSFAELILVKVLD